MILEVPFNPHRIPNPTLRVIDKTDQCSAIWMHFIARPVNNELFTKVLWFHR
uniref:Uncharacterized protein n=1 Tax=Magnetospirillum gryphiswaldense TaxID=55518 RepID=A4U2H7_9PROT|nr:hypothetical protein MGR_3587 [Magnetospirillum gryphiswaldense MSR-1]